MPSRSKPSSAITVAIPMAVTTASQWGRAACGRLEVQMGSSVPGREEGIAAALGQDSVEDDDGFVGIGGGEYLLEAVAERTNRCQVRLPGVRDRHLPRCRSLRQERLQVGEGLRGIGGKRGAGADGGVPQRVPESGPTGSRWRAFVALTGGNLTCRRFCGQRGRMLAGRAGREMTTGHILD